MRLGDDLIRIPPKGIKAQRDFLLSVLEENQEDFRRLFSEMAIENPLQFLRLYRDFSSMVVPKQNELNVSLTLSKDFQELQALGSTSLPTPPAGLIEPKEYEELDEG